MKKWMGTLAALLGVAGMVFWGVLWSVERVGTDAKLYRALQGDILEYAGISEADLVRADETLAACLKGADEAQSGIASLTMDVFGANQPAFNERERIHMEDCRGLFNLLRTVKNALIVSPVPALAGIFLLRNRKRCAVTAWLAPLVILLPLGALGVWAAMDFDGAFNFFHQVLFSNDLWLLNPDTDLLIRICPEEMFAKMGAMIGGMSILWMLLIPSAASLTAWISEKIGGKRA